MPDDPTSRADEDAAEMRSWYERNRERWWQRIWPWSDRSGWHADEFMLRLIAEVDRIRGR